MIVDIHAHVAPKEVAQRTIALFEERTGTKLIYDFSPEKLIEIMTAVVDKALMFNVVLKPDIVPKSSDWVAQKVKENPGRLVGMLAPHPDFQGLDKELERCVKELGFVGVKMNGSLHRFFPNDARMRPLYRKAEELGVPVLVHTGRNVENFKVKEFDRSEQQYSEPASWRPVLEAFPKMTVVLAHMAGAIDFWDDALRLMDDFPGAYADLSMCLEALPDEKIVRFIRTVGAERVMYGSDYPGFNSVSEIERIRKLDISEEDKKQILGENAARVFRLS